MRNFKELLKLSVGALGVIVVIISAKTAAFSQMNVKVEIANYDSDTLLLGYYYWDKQYIKDTIFRKDNECFEIEYDEDLPHGMYMLITPPANEFIQIALDDDQKFTVSWDQKNPTGSLTFKGSKENERFQNYVDYLNQARKKAEELQARESVGQEAMDSLNQAVRSRQEEILKEHPESMAALVIKTNEDIEMPPIEGSTDEVKEKQYQYYLNHFLDNVDLSDPRLPYTSFLFGKVDRYMKKVVMQIPDSINNALDRILGQPDIAPKTFKVILIHYLNEYANSEYVGMDAVYVHLVDKYYATGLATWVDDESLIKMKDDAAALRPILLGKIAPDITLKKRDGSRISLHEIEAEYVVLIFWAPDCGHCKKAMPKLKDIYPELKESGVEVLAVCTKLLDKEAGCWDFIDEHDLDLWLNATDKFLKSRFKQKYNVKSTPQLFILNSEKEIVTKKIAIEKVPEVLKLLRKIEMEKEG